MWTPIITCAAFTAHCWLASPWISKTSYKTEHECQWIAQESLKFVVGADDKFYKIGCIKS